MKKRKNNVSNVKIYTFFSEYCKKQAEIDAYSLQSKKMDEKDRLFATDSVSSIVYNENAASAAYFDFWRKCLCFTQGVILQKI